MKTRIGRPPGADSRQTRGRILEAARALFASQGYAATTNKMIAARAGLTAAAVYHHFGSKPEVFAAIYKATQDTAYERLRPAVDEADSFVGKVSALLEASLRLFEEDPDMAQFVAVAPLEVRRHSELAALEEERRWQDLYAELASAGVRSGEIRSRDRHAVRGMLAAIVLGLSQVAAEVDAKRHAEYIHAFQRLLGGDLVHQSRPAPRRRTTTRG